MNPFQPTKRSEELYYRDILGIVRKFFQTAEDVAHLLLRVPEWLEAYARQAAEAMVTMQRWENARSWREAAMLSSRGREIYAAVRRELRGGVGREYRALVDRNAELITSLPGELAVRAVRRASAAALAGQRAESLLGEAVFSRVARARARLIARTETAKAQTALTEARAEDLGLEWYEWQTAEDQRVRPSHKKMQSVLVAWSDPPSPESIVGQKNPPAPYQAGGIYNCRCYPAPLLKFSQVAWPHKVFHKGRIEQMTLARFRSLSERRMAA